MNHHLNINHANPIHPDPLETLKQEHHSTLQRLDMIERTLQYLESLPSRTALKRCKVEQARLRDWVNELYERLSRHFLMEEEVLFPVLAEYIGKEHGPIEVMVQEHANITSELANWKSAVSELCKLAGPARDAVLKVATGAGYRTIAQLRLHISKEDQILFKICEVSLSEEEKKLVFKKLQAIESH
ncbi:MAG: hemerythrin domain-containing protein [Nitrospiria bacterium]